MQHTSGPRAEKKGFHSRSLTVACHALGRLKGHDKKHKWQYWSLECSSKIPESAPQQPLLAVIWFLISEQSGWEFQGESKERGKERLKFSEQSRAGKGKRTTPLHQNQTTSSNSFGNVRGVIYGGEEMALFERCHVWALWFTVMTGALASHAPRLLR